MTQKEAQIRNNNIMRFRGNYNIIHWIPKDIFDKLSEDDQKILELAKKSMDNVIKVMNESSGCHHIYFDDNYCNYCGHKKYSRDKLGKGTYNNDTASNEPTIL